jgi:hypothetical protein
MDFLSQRLDSRRLAALLQTLPVVEQLRLMKLSPCFHKPQLLSPQVPCDQLNRIYGEDADLVLTVGVEVRSMMWRSGFGKHADNDSEKPAQLRHTTILKP